ncbi:hypothetical protein, partial [Thiolapillus sp.]|uniref:hypothetical protein n=1 Tax=Thiolapillus sp. TaxID=2017437 RepID=UPI0025F23531
MRTTGKQCGLAATGVYQPSLRSPWLAAEEVSRMQQSAYRTSSNGQYEQNSNFISPENIRWNNVAYSK